MVSIPKARARLSLHVRDIYGGVRGLTLVVGLHLTPLGYKLVYEEVMKAIKDNYPNIDPDRMPYKYSPWEQAVKRGRKDSGHAV